ncbi:hypothetical protein [Microcystis phage Mae-Yong1326-1]|nr:hypothetical protein [Microcystis phage Mae-Yong1326-1]
MSATRIIREVLAELGQEWDAGTNGAGHLKLTHQPTGAFFNLPASPRSDTQNMVNWARQKARKALRLHADRQAGARR